MSFNPYSVYSAVSVSEGYTKEDIQITLDVTKGFKELKTAEEAKKYVKARFNIEKPVTDYSIGNKTVISITEDEKLYSVNLVFSNENVTYMFAK